MIAEMCGVGNALGEVRNQLLESSVQPLRPRDTGAGGETLRVSRLFYEIKDCPRKLAWIKSSTTLGAGITISFEPSDDFLALVAALRTGNLDSFFLEHGETIFSLTVPEGNGPCQSTAPR